jgi:hypothetical protein
MLVFIQSVRYLKSLGYTKPAILSTVQSPKDLQEIGIELTLTQKLQLTNLIIKADPKRLNDLYDLAVGAF